jgi:hypothetical protein
MADIAMKRGDSRPKLVRNLKQTVNTVETAINLTTATSVLFHMRRNDGAGALLGGTCAITNAVTGEVTYTWVTADTASAASYNGEFQINWNDGGVETVPNGGFITIDVLEDLD